MMRLVLLAAALLTAGAHAQVEPIPSPTPSGCPSRRVPGFHHFDHPATTSLTIGEPAKLTLTSAIGQTFTPPRSRAPAAGTDGGTFPLVIATAGTYRIAISDKAWIDLVRTGVVVPSSTHSHGPDCSGIAKIVDFVLAPGSYQVQLSEAKKAEITMMVAAAN